MKNLFEDYTVGEIIYYSLLTIVHIVFSPVIYLFNLIRYTYLILISEDKLADLCIYMSSRYCSNPIYALIMFIPLLGLLISLYIVIKRHYPKSIILKILIIHLFFIVFGLLAEGLLYILRAPFWYPHGGPYPG